MEGAERERIFLMVEEKKTYSGSSTVGS